VSTPIEITREVVAAHEARFDDALEIATNEFASLDADAATPMPFARLLKWDPLDRVESLAKFDVVMELIRTRPEAIGLRIECGGNPAREGMLSIVQSQVVIELRRYPT
jgi:hypothetical protein